MKLDRDVHRTRDLEDRRGDVAVERDLAVGIVVGEEQIVFPARGDHALEILARRHGGRRVVRIIEIDELGFLQHIRRDLLQLEQKIGPGREVVEIRLGIGENGAALIHGVARHRHDPDIAGIEHRSCEVRDAFFGAEQRMQLFEWIDADPEAPLHVSRGGFTKRGEAQLEGVATHGGILHGAGQRLHGDVGRREVRVPRSHVDHIHTLLDQSPLDRG